MVDWSCKKLEMAQGKDKDTLNLTFILRVDNYFVVGNFIRDLGKKRLSRRKE